MILSCSPKLNKASLIKNILYPAAPDTARIQYLTSFSSSLDISKKQTAFEKTVVGVKKALPIYKPYGVFMRNGKIYVFDIALGGALEILDFAKSEFTYFIPKGTFKLNKPINGFVDANNMLYIADLGLHKIAVINAEGKYVNSFGKEENKKPSSITIQGNKIFVADLGKNRINVYDKATYKFEYYFPQSNSGDKDYLYLPANITALNDKIYVSDMGSGDVKIFTLEGKYLQTIGQYGKNIGDFVRPKGIAVDKEENIYVVDASFENVQIFNKEGQLLMFFGGPYIDKGDMWLPTSININYEDVKYFKKYVNPNYDLKYLIIVANQYGPDKISVYGRVELKVKTFVPKKK
ncbi:MAG: 6-bladed beta-propeller [Candidatus Lindowbacteria bacterium]|nr:6-bladed beta-propeller [Candidatus Lindowbacteria bacterium]